MARVALGAAQPLRLDHHQSGGIFEAHRFGQRGVVPHAQVALEPNQCSPSAHLNCPPGSAAHGAKKACALLSNWPLWLRT